MFTLPGGTIGTAQASLSFDKNHGTDDAVMTRNMTTTRCTNAEA